MQFCAALFSRDGEMPLSFQKLNSFGVPRYPLVLTVCAVILILIFVHELGHFLAARWRGLKVERFAIWFGKPIWSTKIGGVEYALGWIPAGGYVSLPQMATMEAIEGKTEEHAEELPPSMQTGKLLQLWA